MQHVNLEDIIKLAMKVGAVQLQEQNLEAEYRFTVNSLVSFIAAVRGEESK